MLPSLATILFHFYFQTSQSDLYQLAPFCIISFPFALFTRNQEARGKLTQCLVCVLHLAHFPC